MSKQIQEGLTVLGLDLSTTCTGFCVMSEGGTLIEYGRIKGSTAGLSKLPPLQAKLTKLRVMADKVIDDLIGTYNPDLIVIEEITGSKNRLGQKTLDGFHWILLERLHDRLPGSLDKVIYYDVTGANGWRPHLQLRLDDGDKLNNKEARKINKKLAKGTTKMPIINMKHLAARYVNARFNLDFNVDLNSTDSDVCDAIGMTSAFVEFGLQKLKFEV